MQQEPARVYQGSPPSATHGWLRRIGGLITFNRRRRIEGKNEINDARVYRQYTRDLQRAQRNQSRHMSRDRDRERYERDRAYRNEKPHPFLHYPHHCRPTYHGAHLRLWGFLTRRRDLISRGMSMREEAERERQRERRKRLRRLEAEGLAIRLGAKEVLHGHRAYRHGSSRHHRDRRHGSRSHRNGFTPIVATTADVGQVVPVSAVPATTVQAIPVARSVSAHRHHRHHSSHGSTAPLVTTASSRGYGHGDGHRRQRSHSHGRHGSYSGTTAPVVQVGNSQYMAANGGTAVVPVSRAPSSRHHSYVNGQYDDRVVPVVHSSSRNGSARYGDPALSRASSSRHGYGRHGHSRAPQEVYVSA